MTTYRVDFDISPDGQPVGGIPQNVTVDLPVRDVTAAATAIAGQLGVPAGHVVVWLVEEVRS